MDQIYPDENIPLSRRIVEKFGLSALHVLESETFRVAQIKGVGKRRAQRALADAVVGMMDAVALMYGDKPSPVKV